MYHDYIAIFVCTLYICTLFQAQYEFIHHALSELVVCGETEMIASNLRAFIESHDLESEVTDAQKHMQVMSLLEP